MCLVAIAHKVHPEFPLIVVANRDEFYSRNTARADWWADAPEVVGGRDLQAGGTWMAVHKTGKWGCVTNYRDLSLPKLSDPPSRGDLIPAFLNDSLSPEAFMQQLHEGEAVYSGYNLLLSDGDEILHYSNQEGVINRLAPGIHGLSNHLLDTPWPKVKRLRQKLEHAVAAEGPLGPDQLFELLVDRNQAPDEELPATGMPLNWERKLSAMFIDIPDGQYGTRVSTLLLRDKAGKVYFEERAFVPKGEARIFEYTAKS